MISTPSILEKNWKMLSVIHVCFNYLMCNRDTFKGIFLISMRNKNNRKGSLVFHPRLCGNRVSKGKLLTSHGKKEGVN